jgi:glucose/arabinose dehydrogenase
MSSQHLRTRLAKPFRRFAPLAVPLAFTFLFAPMQSVSGTTLPSGFAEKQYATGLTNPTAMAFAPDPCPASGTPVHRLFVCEQAGRVRVFRNGVLQPTAFLSVAADTRGERGLDGICFDPNFATNHYVYIYYTIFQSNTSLPTHNRLSRFTANPSNPDVAVAGSETPIMEMDDLSTVNFVHNGSAMHFGPDGKLYVAVGENAYGPNSQSFNTVLGKILRINPVPENPIGTNPISTFPTDNPFYNSTTGKNKAIYILGVRNPFTFNFQPGTGRLFVDDVGASTWEEINLGVKGGNYGWPTYEGPVEPPVPGFINPIFAYMHFSGTPMGCAITGGAFYNPAPLCSGDPPSGFPSSYVGQYFFLDLCGGWIYTMDPTQIDPTSPYGFHKINLFASGIHGSPTYLTLGPDAKLYYISRDDGAVYQIRYPASLAPTIGTQPANQLVGQGWPATFTVAASGIAPLHYRWQRNNTDISGAADSPSYTLSSPQVATDNGATFRCIVSNAYGTTASASALLTVIPQQPPTPTITVTTRFANHYYNAGDTISFSGSATDPQDGTLAPSALTWQILFEHHALSNPNHHTHPFFPPTSGITNGTVTLNFGETDPDVWYRIFLTAIDSYGLSQTRFTDVLPRHAQLSLTTNPVGLKVKLDGSPKNTPYSFWGVINTTRNIGVDTPQVLNGQTYDFQSWSDNGARFHNIATPGTATSYVANFSKRGLMSEISFGGIISLSPNPIIVTDGSGLGAATVNWNSWGTSIVEVRFNSPSGAAFASWVSGVGSQTTGKWIQNGDKFYLQDVSGGKPLTSANTLAVATAVVQPSLIGGTISLSPNPITVTDGSGLGVATVTWNSWGTAAVQVRFNSPSGAAFTGVWGPGVGSATTGKWVQNGDKFYLQDVSGEKPLTSANTLAVATAVVQP